MSLNLNYVYVNIYYKFGQNIYYKFGQALDGKGQSMIR